MTVTYDLSSTNTTTRIRSRLRLTIGDTVTDAGPRPGGRNFSDDELDALLRDEGHHPGRAAALAWETLAAEWSTYAGSYRLGPESEEYRQAQMYAQLAAEKRKEVGTTQTADEAAVSGFVSWERGFEEWQRYG